MEFSKKKFGCVLVIKPVHKRIDVSVSTFFKSSCADLINVGNRQIVLDLSSVEFVDSSGLGAIISIWKTLKQSQGQFAICGIKGIVMNLFTLTRMNTVVPIFTSDEEAVYKLASQIAA